MLLCVLPSWPLRIASCLLFCTLLPLEADPPPRLYTVENYQVSLQPDFTEQRVFGEVSIRLHSLADTAIAALEFDAGSLVVTSVLEGNVTQSFERSKSKLFVVLSQPLSADEPRTVTVRYEALPAAGLKFFPDQIYTSIPSDWMPCNDVPSERATLHLTVTAPQNMKAAASGRLIGTRASGEQTITEWQLDSPADPSSFGFALGSFAESTSGNLHILAAGTEIPSSAQILESTAAAMLYLVERTGKPYPAQIYTQVFIHGDLIHSLASGLTLLPESYAQSFKKQPEDLWLLTAELAHQWYGVAITPKDWSNLWLSDGISAYLADAFLGQRFGKQKYQLEIEHSRNIFDQLHAQGKDRPLSDSDSELTSRQEAEGAALIHEQPMEPLRNQRRSAESL